MKYQWTGKRKSHFVQEKVPKCPLHWNTGWELDFAAKQVTDIWSARTKPAGGVNPFQSLPDLKGIYFLFQNFCRIFVVGYFSYWNVKSNHLLWFICYACGLGLSWCYPSLGIFINVYIGQDAPNIWVVSPAKVCFMSFHSGFHFLSHSSSLSCCYLSPTLVWPGIHTIALVWSTW